jgi:ComF family protein
MFFIHKMIDAVLPPRCVITGDVVDFQGMIAPEAWRKLSFISQPYCDCCGFPFEYAPMEGEVLCAACLRKKPEYTKARAALAYDNASRDLILGFKHGDKTHAVVAMAPWLRQAAGNILNECDIIIPVPLHRWRLLRRRYNQSALIAQAIANETGKTCLTNALMRTRATPVQGHLNISERARNVRKAFMVSPAALPKIQGKNVLLIDDVYTTGATVSECAKSLFAAGAGEVNVLTLARVIKPAKIL